MLFISLSLVYGTFRIAMLIISLLGYDFISPTDGKEFIIGTLIPDFVFLFIFCIFSLLYFNNTKAVFAINFFLLIILLFSVIPRFYVANTYSIIEEENSKSDYAISYTLHKVEGEEYDRYTVYTFKKVASFIYKPQGKYSYEGSQYNDIRHLIYKNDYELKHGNTLILGNYEIPLE